MMDIDGIQCPFCKQELSNQTEQIYVTVMLENFIESEMG